MGSWLSLEEVARKPIAEVGNKAFSLAVLAARGAPVLPGWLLPANADIDPAQAARELLEADPKVHRWILRSSSPLEDRGGASAAGLFASVDCDRAELADAIERVRASARAAAAAELLGESAPLAILAQPFLEPEIHLTLELRRDGTLILEPDADEELLAEWPGWRSHCEPEADWPGALIEALRHRGRWWLLQKRPAPGNAPIPNAEWHADREHCIRPLCPLLASLLEGLAGTDERLVDGVWYRRRQPARRHDYSGESSLLEESESILRDCRIATEDLLKTIRADGSLDLDLFFERWTALNRLYFSRPTHALRGFLVQHPPRPGSLRAGIAARRPYELRNATAEQWPQLLERHGHFCSWPWDGRGVCAWEDPSLLRELAEGEIDESPSSDPTPSSLADRIALHLEDDDDTLARIYALLRLALRRAVTEAGIAATRWQEALELDAQSLLRLLRGPDAEGWDRALDLGLQRARRWAESFRQADAAPGQRGVGVVPGRVRAPICRRDSALEGGMPPRDCILVVRAISPLDAVVFGRIAALAVESGDRLGHASILAREYGLPTVIGLGVVAPELRDGVDGVLDAMEGTLALP